ncbi:MAG: GAF domain-containing protein [Fulvivirga sp.]|uniref:GAF domain-containing protein n=1 Tax=Fulvivirga sp. TaxID=1931237 RepID=UPI0032EAAC4A
MSKQIQTNSFPFSTKLNLAPLVEYWEANLESNNIFHLYPTDRIKELIKAAPELKEPIEDLESLKNHKELLGLLMSAIMPPALMETEYAAALVPFNFLGFYATPGYRKLLPLDKIRTDITSSFKDNDMEAAKIFRACLFVLNKFYGTDLKFDQPVLVSIPESETKLDRIYKVEFNLQFADVIAKKPLKPLSKEQIQLLMSDIYNTELWLEYIEPDRFEFQGFSLCHLVDVTEGEMLSRIKYDLLKKDAVICPKSFETIQQKIRSIFNLPQMQLGLSFFDIDNNIMSNQGMSGWNSFMMPNQKEKLSCDYFVGSVYDKANELKRPVIIEDLEAMPNKSHIEKELLKKGIKNVAVAPIMYDDQVIGMLELGTPYAGKLNAISASKMEAVLPMFSAAVYRVLEEMKTEVRALIQEECTAIHPSVEWRFLQEGYDILSKRMSGRKEAFGSIVFENVYPLYGMSDIRNSSLERNSAIQEDLKQNLNAAKKVLKAISEKKNMPILKEIDFRINKEIKKIAKGLNSGDESSVIDFLKNEIVPAFDHFKTGDDDLLEIINNYESQLDPALGVIYNKRKDFEESLTQINKVISEYLEEVELEAQNIFPHYFEKYKTDGVEYNIYMGQSMVNDREFSPLYLNNFRLWQLIVMCEIAAKVDGLKNKLSKPLDITQLILVHGEALSIKFRKDEKHFDVDGAYNIRYEIVKKRIDKAFIFGTEERLTQPGKIAIVYTQQKERDEYVRYIQYLQSIGYLTDNVEYLELEELQGAHGLKAIRVEVDGKAPRQEFGNEVIQNVLEALEA